MDLELTDEQRWLQESIDMLLEREWLSPEAVAEATPERRRRVWDELVAFGAMSIGEGEPMGAVEGCLIARSLGGRLAAAPFVSSAAFRLAITPETAPCVDANTAIALALLEPSSSSSPEQPATTLRATAGGFVLSGEKVAIEQADLADRVAVLADLEGEAALAIVAPDDPAVAIERRTSFDPTLQMSAATLSDAAVAGAAALSGRAARNVLDRLGTAGALLAGAEAIGAAERILDEARRYAAERRQFGRTIGSFQALRHLLAEMYVRCASGWSAILYAAAAFDDGDEQATRAASIAKAYVSRGAREVAHGAMQVFGGIAFTAEHPAHRFLRRILVREQQFGDAAYHERALGRALAGECNGLSRLVTAAAAGAAGT
jgi:alkylation response protein AidB-like acyl-CoA dehydrogenase